MLTVTLKQQMVDQRTPLGVVKTAVPQMEIWGQMADNPKRLVGYVGTQPGAPINIILQDLPDELLASIMDQVRAQLSTAGTEMAVAPSTTEVKELNQKRFGNDESDDLDDDEETETE
jgi:hypothetical protein